MYPISAFIIFQNNQNNSNTDSISLSNKTTVSTAFHPFSPPPSSLTQALQQQQKQQNNYDNTTTNLPDFTQSTSVIIPVITIEPGSRIPPGGLPLEELYKKFPNCKIFETQQLEKEVILFSQSETSKKINVKYEKTNSTTSTIIYEENKCETQSNENNEKEAVGNDTTGNLDVDKISKQVSDELVINSATPSNSTSSTDDIIIQIYPS
ncbi:hypothetical protein KGF54_002248 [Candida jiufengensis]|uniref:uncharacterized protein n=1 Tax=Candida jiufengensis TaxID=497108 RepID=UPI0022240045|nr:uncharacterized protein KGF54_002248 [Candida jiufengensis]KAI5954473.1 hypothetical protein KGF54_002248 [Candida jiufengensis]